MKTVGIHFVDGVAPQFTAAKVVVGIVLFLDYHLDTTRVDLPHLTRLRLLHLLEEEVEVGTFEGCLAPLPPSMVTVGLQL